jgi:hypothetical protein
MQREAISPGNQHALHPETVLQGRRVTRCQILQVAVRNEQMEVVAELVEVFLGQCSHIVQGEAGRGAVELALQVVYLIIFFLIYFFKMVGSYKFPEGFEQLVVVDGLEREMLVANAKLRAE